MRFLIANPTASLYNNRTQILAALEFACLDILGQAWGVPVCDILGGRLRDRVPFAAYCFFRYPNPRTGEGEVRTIDQVVANAENLKRALRLHHPQDEGRRVPAGLRIGSATARWRPRCPGIPTASTPTPSGPPNRRSASARPSKGCATITWKIPVYGLNGMRRVREKVRVPLATNTVVVNFEQLAANALDTAVDVILLDTTFWGGIRACVKAAAVCETFQLGVAVHSSGELGIQLASMLHLGAVLPNLIFRRRRALPSPDRRHHRGRAHEV